LIKLFETEVPEIYDGAVKIVRVARAPGFRSKIAVATTNKDIDPVGACVGMRGIRIQSITNELRGEKIDIIPYSDNPSKFVVSALSSVEVSNIIVNEDLKSIAVIVPDDQLALAIGKQGQNVRLASKITGYKIDILSESKISAKDKNAYKDLMDIPGVGEITAKLLYDNGYITANDIVNADAEKLAKDISVDVKKAEKIINSASVYSEKVKSDVELKEKIEKDTI
ncbi:MAG: helix-hairpin-helix domain-containing protein, partial [Deltaproteobacteria bacterium]|nr:helix-hairpin-helix domain-containing protein [Deltaproteobacteria bacterium]